MERYEDQLRLDLEKKVGFRIANTTEAKRLLNSFLENNINGLSLSTIRRFFGLIEPKKPHASTFNKFANYLGYTSYNHYVRDKNINSQWFLESELQKIKYKDQLTSEDYDIIFRSLKNSQSSFMHVSLFEYAVSQGKWQFVDDLFNHFKLPLYFQQNSGTDFTVKNANLVHIWMNSISESEFERVIPQLIRLPHFKSSVLYLHIDLFHMNHRYGRILNAIFELPDTTEEERLFLRLIRALSRYLSNLEIPPREEFLSPEQLSFLPDQLVGRYLGYQVLTGKLSQDHQLVTRAWETMLKLASTRSKLSFLFHEFISALLILNEPKLLEKVFELAFDTIFDYVHIHTYLDVFIYNLIDALLSYRANDHKRATHLFNNLNTKKVEIGNYGDYYLFFYDILGFHLSNNKNNSQQYLNRYLAMADVAGFKLFSESYCRHYFD